jgi:tRNA(Ile)-lysidine synthase
MPGEEQVTADLLYRQAMRLAGDHAAANDRFGVAVSGGPDSMALLLLAAEAFPGRVEAATIDHGLRAESTAEAAWVAGQCASLGIPHMILRPAQPISGSLQAAARTARYSLLEQWRKDGGIDWLMTAHHADDQLETMIMRLNRASGVGGLAGVRARQGSILRPLLGTRHSDLVAVVRRAGMTAIDDPSNCDHRFDRARLRQQLQGQSLIDVASAAASADHLADADAALDWAVRQLLYDRLTTGVGILKMTVADLPIEFVRRLVVQALMLLDPQKPRPRGATLDRALTLLLSGQTAMIGDIRIDAGHGDSWCFTMAPRRRHSE